MENAETKQCPYCAETVLAAAVICKHCRSNLGGGASIPATPKNEALGALGALMLATPVLSIALIFFWVGNMALIQDPGSTLSFLVVATVIGTAILAAMEAKLVGAGSNVDMTQNGKTRSGPGSWFAVTLLLWVFGFPAWLYQRSRYGLRNLAGLGVIVMTLFVVVSLCMNQEIQIELAGITRALQKASPQPQPAIVQVPPQQPGTGEPVEVSNEPDWLQFGKPAVKKTGYGGTRVKVMAKNISGQRISLCMVTATFVKGDTILGAARGSVRDIAPGLNTSVELMATDNVNVMAYDTLNLETTRCY